MGNWKEIVHNRMLYRNINTTNSDKKHTSPARNFSTIAFTLLRDIPLTPE